MSSLKILVPTITEIREKVKNAFGQTPCEFRVRDIEAQLERKDCITIARIGSGKTLTFWAPLLFNDNGIIIVVTALNILGEQNVAELARLDIAAVNVTAETANDTLFKLRKIRMVSRPRLLDSATYVPKGDGGAPAYTFTARIVDVTILVPPPPPPARDFTPHKPRRPSRGEKIAAAGAFVQHPEGIPRPDFGVASGSGSKQKQCLLTASDTEEGPHIKDIKASPKKKTRRRANVVTLSHSTAAG